MKRIFLTILLCLGLTTSAFSGNLFQDKCKVISAKNWADGGCDPATNEVGDRSVYGSVSTRAINTMGCHRYIADCSGTFGKAQVYHSGETDEDIKVAIFDSDYQTDITTSQLPTSADTLVGSWVTIECATNDGWCTSGASKIGGSAVSGHVYLLCAIAGTTYWTHVRDTTAGGNYIYSIIAGTWGSYASPPNTLDDGNQTWSAFDDREYSWFVEIE